MKKYLVQKPCLKAALFCVDSLLSVLFMWKKERALVEPKKILLSNIAHLGDVVIATSVLPLIKQRFPDCKIGFLVGSWSSAILDNHPLVDYVHTMDHWKLSRKKVSFWKKFQTYRVSRKKALAEIRRVGYDAAVDLYSFLPNSIYTLARANIPYRIGYDNAGFGPLLSKSLTWTEQNKYMSFYHKALLQLMGIEGSFDGLPCLHMNYKKDIELPEKYVLFHVGSGSEIKEWSAAKWSVLLSKMKEAGLGVVFTGTGERELVKVNQINQLFWGVNLVDQLDLNGLMLAIKQAQLVIASDSVVIHMAAGLQVTALSIFCGINNPLQWTPPSCAIVIKNEPCIPCHKKSGCDSMTCLQGVSVDEVFEKIKAIFA